MRPIDRFEFPPEQERIYRQARVLQWTALAYLISTAVLMFITMGSSQAMRTAFFEDTVSLIPAAAFLIGTRVARLGPKRDFPYGRHRATSIAHLAAALALAAMGAYLLFEAAYSYLSGHKVTIGGVALFGSMVWGGWPMLAALLYASLPAVWLGRRMLKLAPKLHDKVLFTSAKMMKADWMTATATGVGVVGAGFGLWWLDPLAAAIVSIDIIHDGVASMKVAVADLMDRKPAKTDQSGQEPLPDQVRSLLMDLDWVADAEVRMREEGHIFIGEAFVVPRRGTGDLVGKIAAAVEAARESNWRMHDLVIQPVARLDPAG